MGEPAPRYSRLSCSGSGPRRRAGRPRAALAAAVTALLLTCVSAAMPQTPTPETRRVLLLHSFSPKFSPWSTISARLREELIKQSPHPINLYEASLQDLRLDQARDQRAFIDYLRALFDGRDPDLV